MAIAAEVVATGGDWAAKDVAKAVTREEATADGQVDVWAVRGGV